MPLGWFKKKEGEQTATQAPAPKPPEAGVPRKTVSVGRLLREDLIVVPPEGLDKEHLIGFLAKELCAKAGLGAPEPYMAKVWEREQGISTTLDTGLAVPHARIDGLADITAVLGILEEGLPDPKQPDLTIRAAFLFFSPNRQEAFSQHLHLLRGVSSLFQPALLDALRAAPSPEAALKLIRSAEAAG